MAGPMPPPTPPGKGGPSLLKNLNPKQKKMLAVVGVGAFLALIFLLSRKTAAPEAPQAGEPVAQGQPDEGFGAPVAAGGTDPTAFLGAQSEQIGSRLEEVSGSLQEVGQGFGEVGDGLDDVQRGQDALGDTFMASQEADEQEFGRVQAGLAGQSRQLKAIREQLKRKNGRGGKGRKANSHKQPRDGGRKANGKRRQGKKRQNKKRQPPRKRRR